MIHFHSWGKWSQSVDTVDSSKKNQFRVCGICGKIQSRSFTCGMTVTSTVINEVISDKESV